MVPPSTILCCSKKYLLLTLCHITQSARHQVLPRPLLTKKRCARLAGRNLSILLFAPISTKVTDRTCRHHRLMCQPSFQHSQINTRKQACVHVPLCACLRMAACMSSQHAVLHSNGSCGREYEIYIVQPIHFHVLLPSLLLCNACTLMTAYHCGSRYVQTPAYAGNEQHPRQQRLGADKARRQVP